MVRLIEFITRVVNNTGFAGIVCGRPSHFTIIIYYSVLVIIGFKSSRKRNIAITASLFILAAGISRDNFSEKFFLALLKSKTSNVLLASEGRTGALMFVGKKDISQKIVKSFLYSKGIRRIRHVYMVHPSYEDLKEVSKIAREFKVEKIFYPGVYGNEKRWNEFVKSLDGIKLQILRKGDIIKYDSMQVKINEPDKKYVDIRDNFLQAEIIGRKKIFLYAGGDIPQNKYDAIVALEPYKPDWETIQKRSKNLVIYCGDEIPPDWVNYIDKKGEVFYLSRN